MTNERKRFHPLVMFVYFIKGIRSWLVFIFIIGINMDEISIYQLGAMGAILVLVILSSVFKYFTQTYQLTPQKIIIYRGLLKKRETDIYYDRIQTIKQRQWFFFKPFKVVELLIETASSTPGEAEASLTAVDSSLIQTIEKLQYSLRSERKQENQAVSSSKTSFILSNKQIVLYALTDMTVFLVFGTAFSFFGDWIPTSFFTNIELWMNDLQWIVSVVAFVIGVIGIVFLSLLKNFILFYQFKATLEEETLSVEYGLVERKIQKIPLKKIQAIKVHKQLIRNLFGLSSVELVLMGGQEKEGEGLASKKVLLFPLIQTKTMYKTLANFLPDRPITEPNIQLVTKRELWYFWRWTIAVGIPFVLGGWFITRWMSLLVFIILVFLLIFQWIKSQKQGYAIQGNQTIWLQQFQGFSTVQLFIARPTTQSFTRSSTKWLMKKNHGHIQVCFKAGDSPAYFDLRFIRKEDEQFIYENFWESVVVAD
ncbi:PH domain-containing protein [Carnobacterium sp. TMP28]|uniref:PH domain-containing protein n=1 Tax=Carnobacterium sp. TMP28 TaxID=3397060 RepID=UPI0039E1DEE7